MPIDHAAARTFLHAEARVLEQRTHAVLFDGADPAPVVAALTAHQNPDGGFGHGLEPDVRCPASQPLFVEVALERLVTAGVRAPDLVTPAFDFLAAVASPGGAVPVLLPSIAGHPRAAHWTGTDEYPADLLGTAGVVAHARALGVEHPWVSTAAAWCIGSLETGGPPAEVHALARVAWLLEAAPELDPAGRRALQDAVASALPTASLFKLEPDPTTYGLTPLDVAPSPDAAARAWFPDEVIEAHLDALEADQQPDGGWPIQWEPPSRAAISEWRGIVTLHALETLAAYGRLPT